MHDVILPDTSSLIFLKKIGEIDPLKKLFSNTIVTNEIAEEHITPFQDWIQIKSTKKKQYQKFLEQSIDKGEASIMALALDMNDNIVSIDDLRARKVARKLDFNLTGTLGILYKAKKAGYIDSMRYTLENLKHFDFRI